MNKPQFTIIKCTPIHERYLQAFKREFTRNMDDLLNDDIKSFPKLIILGVKYISEHRYKNKDYIEREEVEEYFKFIESIRVFMTYLTPTQFVNLFPITKDFDGDKYECKDYFYTINELKNYDMDAPLLDKLEDFMWDYVNDYISDFMIEMFSTASKLRKLNGGMGILEEWAEKNDIDTYTVNEKAGYIIDNQTHKSMPFHKESHIQILSKV